MNCALYSAWLRPSRHLRRLHSHAYGIRP